MNRQSILLEVLISCVLLVLHACSTQQPLSPEPTGSPTATLNLGATRGSQYRETLIANQTPRAAWLASHPTPTSTTTPESTPTPEPYTPSVRHPYIDELVASGYESVPFEKWETTTLGGAYVFGGPAETDETTHEYHLVMEDGRHFVYLQYMAPWYEDCEMLFFEGEGDSAKMLGHFSARGIVRRLLDYGDETTTFCIPYGWSDLNQNDQPDLMVGFMFGNHFWSSDMKILEVRDSRVVDLTMTMPGVISMWNYDPEYEGFIVSDVNFAYHDCIYPPMHTFWIYGWRDGYLVDMTSYNLSDRYFPGLEANIESYVGKSVEGIQAEYLIESLTIYLVMKDRVGERLYGWEKYATYNNPDNFPGSPEEVLTWLRADFFHFYDEIVAGGKLTPNDYCPY